MVTLAGVAARARRGVRLLPTTLREALVGLPGSRMWNPPAQAATILGLIEAGADPNAAKKRGVLDSANSNRTGPSKRSVTAFNSGDAQTFTL